MPPTQSEGGACNRPLSLRGSPGALNGAIEIGEQFRLPVRASVHGNAADLSVKRDMPDAIQQCEAALATGRQLGNRAVDSISIGNLMMARLLAGDWDEVGKIGNEALERPPPDRSAAEDIHFHLGLLAARRGRLEEASSRLARVAAWESGDDVEARQLYVGLDGLIALGEGTIPAPWSCSAIRCGRVSGRKDRHRRADGWPGRRGHRRPRARHAPQMQWRWSNCSRMSQPGWCLRSCS